VRYVRPILGSLGLIALMLAASTWAYPRLGDQPIAIHFDAMGHPNGYASRSQALLIMPEVAAPVSVLLAALPPIMPNQSRLERSWGPYVVVWMGMLTLLGAIHFGLIAHALGAPLNISRLSVGAIGLLMAVIGNLLGKVRYNYVFGVRTPWTLASERVWDRTHRFAGWTLTLGGLVAFILAILAPTGMEARLHVVLLMCVLGPALAAVVYSYLTSRKEA
jgi:uncharacterized membrane protein